MAYEVDANTWDALVGGGAGAAAGTAAAATPLGLGATLAIIGGSQLASSVGEYFGQKDAEEQARARERRQMEFTRQENEKQRELQRQSLDFQKYQSEVQAPQRAANVMQTLMPYQQMQDRRRFLDTGIGTISRR